jgi:hypothetical protein
MSDNRIKQKEPKYHPPIHAFPIYGLIVCAAILILIGIYLYINNIEVLGNANGDSFGVNGFTSIGFGIALLIFPIYTLIKQYREKKRFDNNIF